MRRGKLIIVLSVMMLLIPIFVNANTIATVSPIDLDHYYYYYWGLNDVNVKISQMSITFYDIYNWRVEPNWLKVYIKDGATSIGWMRAGKDDQSLQKPDWSTWTFLGEWSDSNGPDTKDNLIFTINDSSILTYLTDGGMFTIGIDPDCHYWGQKITVDVTPVPEPTILILLGFGLLGLGFIYHRVKVYNV